MNYLGRPMHIKSFSACVLIALTYLPLLLVCHRRHVVCGKMLRTLCWDHSRNRPTATDDKKKSLPYFGCDFSDGYNFRKIVKIVATRCHIFKIQCTKFDFGWGFAPDPAVGAYSTPPDPIAGFKGACF